MNAPRHIPILCYHRVCPPEERGPDSPSLCVSPEQFALQMGLLETFGHRPITAQHLAAALAGRKTLPDKPVVITFDDGYEDNYQHAFPILKRYGFPATIFLVTNHLGKTNSWDSGSQKLLNEAQIKEMVLGGVDFGSHSAGHLDMARESPEKIRVELERSKAKLEELTGRLDISFCYPYARSTQESRVLVMEAGYLCAFSGDAGKPGDLFDLPRVQVFPSTSLFGFWKKIQPWYPRWMAFQKKIKNKK